MLGKCALCLLQKDLQKSHLLPRSLYKKVRTTGRKNNDPFLITTERRRSTSHQFQDYLLCKDCEHRFNVGGEKYVMELALVKGRVPLLEMLQKSGTPIKTIDWESYSVKTTPQVDRDKLAYFALSVFWRASVHTWENEDGSSTRIQLGCRYNEELRQYLMGLAPMPSSGYLKVSVCTDALHQNMFFAPAPAANKKLRMPGFMACGIDFRFAIGGSVPAPLKRLSMLHTPDQWISVYDCSKHKTWSLAPSEN
jgi:hypothetical protein